MNNELYTLLKQEYNETFKGWDFSYLTVTGRMQEFPLTWNYRLIIKDYLKDATSLLDMGTGGGEFLSSLEELPSNTSATEGYEPNVAIAQKRLQPLGIDVRQIRDDAAVPFETNSFDLILNRHESYDGSEVHRLLKKEGFFITQQVGGMNDKELNELLGAPASQYSTWNLKEGLSLIEDYLHILDTKELLTKTRFYDIESIVYYLKAIPWQVPDFSVEKYMDKLELIHDKIRTHGYLDITCHRFLIIAKKI